jgi:hypothetical protein
VPRVAAEPGAEQKRPDQGNGRALFFPPRFAMQHHVAALRYPYARVLLPRTRLAYIHLRNLLTDAKRDRSARVSGYVAIWLPEEFLTLYMQRGEVVNAAIRDKDGSQVIAIAKALEKVPTEPEYGEICFHEADEAQLACMFTAQTKQAEAWPDGLAVSDPAVLFPYLMAITFDGSIEIVADDTVNYLVFKNGNVERAFMTAGHNGTLVDRVAKLFAREGRTGSKLQRWPEAPPLPVQAPPALVQAYRDLATGLIQRLIAAGKEGAPAIAEQARQNLLTEHDSLEGFSFNGRPAKDPVTETAKLTKAMAAWMKEVIWAAVDHDVLPPEQLIKELTWDRRHMFQSAGLYDQLPWRVV